MQLRFRDILRPVVRIVDGLLSEDGVVPNVIEHLGIHNDVVVFLTIVQEFFFQNPERIFIPLLSIILVSHERCLAKVDSVDTDVVNNLVLLDYPPQPVARARVVALIPDFPRHQCSGDAVPLRFFLGLHVFSEFPRPNCQSIGLNLREPLKLLSQYFFVSSFFILNNVPIFVFLVH